MPAAAGSCEGALVAAPVQPSHLPHPLPPPFHARRKTATLAPGRCITLPTIALNSWFNGRHLPLAVGVAFWLDGKPAVPRVASRLTPSGVLRAGLQPTMKQLAGSTVWGLRLVAAGTDGAGGVPAEVDVLLTGAAHGGGASGSGGGGSGGGTDRSIGGSDEEDGSSDSGSSEGASGERGDGNRGDSDSDAEGGSSHRAAPAAGKRTRWEERLDGARRVLEGGVSAGAAPPAPGALEALCSGWPLRARP
jgi:hypothetical protein